MIMALWPRIKGIKDMLTNKWTIFSAALIIWVAYFYAVDLVLMEAQGLPVNFNLMPE